MSVCKIPSIPDVQCTTNISTTQLTHIPRQTVMQATDYGKKLAERDRCWRCRLAFGFTWMSAEADPAKTAKEKLNRL